VTRTIWLASYSKSGNTWLRMLIANLSATDAPADINDLPERGGIASARGPFDFLTLIDSGLLTHDECDRLRPRVYEALARGEQDDEYDEPDDAPPVRFVKAHDAYTFNADGGPLLAGARGADGAVVIVRDPRDVAPSLAHHSGIPIDRAIARMADAESAFCGKRGRQHSQLRQQLLGWSRHAASWLDQSDIPVLPVRYEDMRADAAGQLRRVLAFAAYPAGEDAIARAVAFARFEQLRGQERDNGFREAPRPHQGGDFFRRGEIGAWRDELTAEQVARIEADHAAMMARLGYAPASAASLARAG
jgi:hypothetical protein